ALNAGKRLLTNAEWQGGALGTPDGAPRVVSSGSTTPSPTGTPGCVSGTGVFDMVGNIGEWVADWVPQSTNCGTALFGTDDTNCFVGASALAGPAALWRGGAWNYNAGAGVFHINGTYGLSTAADFLGF